MLTILALVIACNDHTAEPEHAHTDGTETHARADHDAHGENAGHGDSVGGDHAAHGGDDHGDAGGLALSLDGDAKWQMDEHTRAVMAETRTALGGTVSDAAGAKALGKQLQEQLDRLIKGCTMDGDAHEELHTFLMVYMPEVGMLQRVGDADAAKQAAAVKALVAEYDRFFE
jgi:hypothetical protein